MDHAVILAGGSGTRLWPMSRRHRPKQLLPLVEGGSLLDLALERVLSVFAPQRTWIVTNADLVPAVRAAAASLPPENVIGEPAIRDTSNAIGLACMLLVRRDEEANVGVFTADHVIRPPDRFAAAVRDALAVLDGMPDALVTLGVLPVFPHTGLGYIQRGEAVGPKLHRVQRFVEKPGRAAAGAYLASGDYYWNSGMFVWRAGTLVDRLAEFRPEHAASLAQAADAWEAGDVDAAAGVYADLPQISIDYALMEPAAESEGCTVLVRELDCQWLDLGAWSVLPEVNPIDDADNLRTGRVVALHASGNILISDDPEHLLAVIGIEDMVVVHSGGATLVAPKARSQDVRKLLKKIKETYGEQYE